MGLTKTIYKQTKKLITISPGGFKGFYMLGICNYIKQHYCLENCFFSGASAGAWNALFMSYKGNPAEFIDYIFDDSLMQLKSVKEIKKRMKEKLMNKYSNRDFDFDRLLISVSSVQKYEMKSSIYSDFDSIEEAVDCCIASSHIPFVTGEMLNKYHNTYSFDGGFSKQPFSSIKNMQPVLHITPSMWEKKRKRNAFQERTKRNMISEYTTLFSRDKYNFRELYENGYADAKKHKSELDAILSSR